MPSYRIRLAGKKKGELYLYDTIGDGYFGGISAKKVSDDLKDLGAIDTLNVRINSSGGDVFQGFAIYNALKRHPARKVVDIDGMALSIASVIAMAGDEINMAANAMLMIHDPAGFSFGSAEDMRRQADLLDQVKESIVDTYVKRTAQNAKRVSDWMSEEKWFKAEEAKEEGFVDSITDELAIAASFDLSRFHNVPSYLNRSERSEDPYRARIKLMGAKVLG